jgi:hypothetical protein
MLNNGTIINCPVTSKDVRRAIEIYGPDLASLKGKSVSKKPFRVIGAEAISNKMFQNADMTLCVDIMFVNGLMFYINVGESIGLVMVSHITQRSTIVLRRNIDDCIAQYRKAGYIVKVIKSDGERGIDALSTYYAEKQIHVNCSSANQHVPVIERKIRQIKERIRAHLTTLPFRVCRFLLIKLVEYCAQSINNVPQTIAEHALTPRELFTGKKLNYNLDLRLEFGAYVQIPNDNNHQKNSMEERTIDAICLRMKGNLQGSGMFYSLKTNKVVTRDRWTVLPMPATVIEKLNKLADGDKLKHITPETLRIARGNPSEFIETGGDTSHELNENFISNEFNDQNLRKVPTMDDYVQNEMHESNMNTSIDESSDSNQGQIIEANAADQTVDTSTAETTVMPDIENLQIMDSTSTNEISENSVII